MDRSITPLFCGIFSAFMSGALLVSSPSFAQETGILRITTDPGGAKIYVDGKRKGSSPTQIGQTFAVKLPEGEYRIEAVLPVDANTEQYGESKDAFIGADTIQSLHIELSPREAQEAVTARLGYLRDGEPFRECDDCPEMVVIPAGSFVMGSPSGEADRFSNEGPQREVSIGRFALSKTEVTFDQWQACVDGGGCGGNPKPDDEGWGRGSRPVINVSWDDAQEYIAWLNGRAGAKVYRLPSESEWEYAARGGTATPFWTGGTISADQANYDGNGTYGNGRKGVYRKKTVPVGSFPSNPFGLHDVHGNVWEWVEDCWHGSYDGAPRDGSPWLSQQEGDCSRRVLRGGYWSSVPWYLRSAFRDWDRPDGRGRIIGFRLARTLPVE